MVSDFVPLIGSGFDSLANQRLQWEQFNANIENQNLARAAQAESRQDNWLANVAQMNQQREEQNFNRQLEADAYVRQRALQSQAESTRQRERSEDITRDTQQRKDQLAYGKNYLDTQQKIAEEKISASEKNKDLVLESQGQHLAANYVGLQNAKQQTAQALSDLHEKIDEIDGQLETERAKKKPDQVKILGLQAKQKLFNQSLRQREIDARAAENQLLKLETHAENAHFDINDDGTITHPDTTKTWNWKAALKAAKASLNTPTATSTGVYPFGPPSVDAMQSGAGASTGDIPWAGFAPGGISGLQPSLPAPAPATNSFSVGRFTVTPQ